MDAACVVRTTLTLLLLAALGNLVACDSPDAQTPLVLEALPTHIEGDGVVIGKVYFDGPIPPQRLFENVACHTRGQTLVDETVIVNENMTLRNVFVYVEDAPAVSGVNQPPAELDQVNCLYVPRLLGVQIGQPLILRSSDPIPHNVHYNPSRNPSSNFNMARAGQEHVTSFRQPEFIRARCDIHPWMVGHIGVFANPFFAVTGSDGSFRIEGLPAGTYTLATWHELYGRQQTRITVAPGGVAEAAFTYAPPRR
jgi:plastocyanin